jgi:hypothetical protein
VLAKRERREAKGSEGESDLRSGRTRLLFLVDRRALGGGAPACTRVSRAVVNVAWCGVGVGLRRAAMRFDGVAVNRLSSFGWTRYRRPRGSTNTADQFEGEESARCPARVLRRRILTVFVNCAAGPRRSAPQARYHSAPRTRLWIASRGKKGGYCRFFVLLVPYRPLARLPIKLGMLQPRTSV